MKLECKMCGANLKYVPSAQKAYCEHCGNYFDVREIEYNPEEYDDFKEYTCSSCGAKLITTGRTEIVKCLYCGGKEFINSKLGNDYLLEGMIPFKIDKKQFKEGYENYLKNLEGVDKNFIRSLKNAKMQGFYLPYSFANQFFRKQYPEHLNELFETVVPYNFKELQKMHPIYFDSFICETIKTNKKENDIKTDDPNFFWVPIWISYIKHKGEDYYIVMNGQTGEIAGVYSEEIGHSNKLSKLEVTLVKFFAWTVVVISVMPIIISILTSSFNSNYILNIFLIWMIFAIPIIVFATLVLLSSKNSKKKFNAYLKK